MRHVLMAFLICALVLLAGCCICPALNGNGDESDTGIHGESEGSYNTAGDDNTVIIAGGNGGSMSDPSKCRNLPLQERLECLERSTSK